MPIPISSAAASNQVPRLDITFGEGTNSATKSVDTVTTATGWRVVAITATTSTNSATISYSKGVLGTVYYAAVGGGGGAGSAGQVSPEGLSTVSGGGGGGAVKQGTLSPNSANSITIGIGGAGDNDGGTTVFSPAGNCPGGNRGGYTSNGTYPGGSTTQGGGGGGARYKSSNSAGGAPSGGLAYAGGSAGTYMDEFMVVHPAGGGGGSSFEAGGIAEPGEGVTISIDGENLFVLGTGGAGRNGFAKTGGANGANVIQGVGVSGANAPVGNQSGVWVYGGGGGSASRWGYGASIPSYPMAGGSGAAGAVVVWYKL